MMLDHYQQTKNMLVSYIPKALGFFLKRAFAIIPGAHDGVL